MLLGDDARRLTDAVASVWHRLAARRAAIAAAGASAVVGGAIAAVAESGLAAAAAVIVAAATGAMLGWRSVRRGAAIAWLDAHERDLIVSGDAVASGAVEGGLAPVVVREAARCAGDKRKPAIAATIAGAAVIVSAAVGAVVVTESDETRSPSARPEPGSRERARVEGRLTDVSGGVGGRVGDGVGTGDGDGTTDGDGIGDGNGDPIGHGHGHGYGQGGGAGDGAAGATRLDPATLPGTATAAVPADELLVTAPLAGASPELARVPPRYRALVAAYLESPP